jgi:hypothetical protein
MACVFHLKETRDISAGLCHDSSEEHLLSSPTLFSLSYGALTLGLPPAGAETRLAPPTPTPRSRP